jgi:hypothetical protein
MTVEQVFRTGEPQMTPPDNKDYRLRLDTGSPDERKRFEVVARPESVFDVMLALWSAFGDEKMSKEQEIGKKFFETFRKEIPVETLAEIERIGVDVGDTAHIRRLAGACRRRRDRSHLAGDDGRRHRRGHPV